MILRQFALSLAALMAISADALGQDTATKSAPADSQIVFNNVCRTCHTLREGDNRLGPNLHNIIGRKAGSLQDYGYSSAMKDADLTWDRATLDRFQHSILFVACPPPGWLLIADASQSAVVALS